MVMEEGGEESHGEREGREGGRGRGDPGLGEKKRKEKEGTGPVWAGFGRFDSKRRRFDN